MSPLSERPEKSASLSDWPSRPLQIVTTCKARDLPVLEITAGRLMINVPVRAVYVIAPAPDCAEIRRRLPSAVQVISEDEFIPNMTLEQLRTLSVPRFPRAAGWYFQQLLKLQFAFVDPEDDYYLIWDADTVPLRPMQFFSPDGGMLLTRADEHHAPYFETYRRLFSEDPRREFSFIAQHMLIQKSVALEMLGRIEQQTPGGENWAWKIMRSLPDQGDNLFSEYETYGHYVKNHYADRVKFIDRAWQREAVSPGGRAIPSENELTALAKKFDYVAFERASRGWRRWVRLFLGRTGLLKG